MLNMEMGANGALHSSRENSGISVSEAIESVERNFQKVDKNKDSVVTSNEISSLPDSELSSRDRMALEAFDKSMDDIKRLSNDESGFESGITFGDLKTMKDDSSEAENARFSIEASLPERDVHKMHVFSAVLEENFARIDRDESGTLSKRELRRFSEDEKTPQEARQVAGLLHQEYVPFSSLSNIEKTSSFERWVSPIPSGPFFNGRSRRREFEFSRDDANALELLARPERFKRAMKGIRTHEMIGGGTMAAFNGAGTLLFGALAAVHPEPASKVALIGITAMCGAGTLMFGGVAAGMFTDSIRDQYRSRQAMLESMRYFE